MKSQWDQRSKLVVEAVLDADATSTREYEVTPLDAQRVDLWIELPASTSASWHRDAGVLGRMLGARAGLEFFSGAPRTAAMAEIVRKALTLQRLLGATKGVAAPRLWVLCARRPGRAMTAFGAVEMAGWPAGFYALPSAIPVSVVVIGALPETRATLLLRLLGRGAVLARALDSLRTMRRRSKRFEDVLDALNQWSVMVESQGPKEQEEFMVDLTHIRQLKAQWKQEAKAQGLEEGRAEGREEGREEGRAEGREEGRKQGKKEGRKVGREEGEREMLRLVCERRLKRPLSPSEKATIVARLKATDAATLLDELLSLGPKALGAWLAAAPV